MECPDNKPYAQQINAHELLSAFPVAIYAVDCDFKVVFVHMPPHFPPPPDRRISNARAVAVGDCLLDHLHDTERTVWKRIIQDQYADCMDENHTSVGFAEVSSAPISRPEWGHVVASVIQGPNNRPKGTLFVCHGVYEQTDLNRVRQEQDAARLDVARQLAVTLNHEINNPLFIISATLEDLLAEAGDPALERRLRASLDAVWRVSSAVKQLQDIRQVVSKAYIAGFDMIDLEASQEPYNRPVITEG